MSATAMEPFNMSYFDDEPANHFSWLQDKELTKVSLYVLTSKYIEMLYG